ncbi:unnamed protein product [Rotaria sordida]|uniref:C2 domain-containing protein n=1 Tax=Rotaria sordida TaxID=392033 RepID=A0A815AG96_9BILA|nr:unnamed protein product [Rotaria sordida]CAF1536008.1 unnamed protein product [Rotaria sordida]
MSSSTSDSSINPSLFDKVTGCVSYVQQNNYVTKKRFHTLRQYFFRSVGFSIILYCFCQLIILFYSFLKLILRLLFQIIFMMILFLFKFIQLFLPQTTNYNILFLLIGFCSIISVFIAKFSYKNIEIHLGKRYKLIKRYPFILTLITLLLLQSVLILLPLGVSIREQRKLSSTPVPFKQPVMKLPEQKTIESIVQVNNFMNNLENTKRELHDGKREEHKSINNGIKLNENGKNLDGKRIVSLDNQLSSSPSPEKDSKIESNVEDDHSYLINHTKQGINTDEISTSYAYNQVSLGEDQGSVLKSGIKYLIDPNDKISSKVLKKSSESIQTTPTETKEFLSDTLKEETIKSSIKSKFETPSTLIFHEKLNNWLDEAKNIWHQTKQFFSLKTTHKKYLSRHNVSSIYTAYTDLNCYDYTKITYTYFIPKQKYIIFLDTYRRRSPFPIYLSILKSIGPQCYRHYPNSSCAISSKLVLSDLIEKLYHFTKFSMIIIIPIIILIIILKNLKPNQYLKKNKQVSNENQQIISNKIEDSSSQKIDSNINNNHILDEKLKKELNTWLEHEKNDGYQNLSEACRIALNNTFSKNNEQLNIETLQFANANIHDVSQASVETIVINAELDIVHLIFNIVNTTKGQHYSIEIPKLTGELQIFLTNYINKYSIEVKFKQIQIDHAEIIDPKNNLSSDEKESIIKLFKETIQQTVVQCCCHLSSDDNKQTNIINESKIESSFKPITPEPSNVYQSYETSLSSSISENNPQVLPEKQAKKLLVRIVKAVKLHDIEQPFCIIELNQPRQTHQTSIAKNSVNPFWDESFAFEINDKSNQIHLKIIDRKKPNKRHNNQIVDKIYADVTIPFSYITSTIYKQDVRITPQHPDSIVRIEFEMVRSRSETNLNRIFIDLCTSPDVRSKFGHQRNIQQQSNRPLPSLKPIKSNSCTNINELSSNLIASSSIENNEREQADTLNLTTVQATSHLENQSIESSRLTTTSLVPMESTGFAVQTTPCSNHHSLALFETLSISHLKKPSLHREISKEVKTKISSLPSNSSIESHDRKHQDFLNRLQNQETSAVNNGYDIESIDDSLNSSNIRREPNNIQHNYQRSPSDEIIALQYKDNSYTNNSLNVASNLSPQTISNSTIDSCSTLTPLSSHIDDNQHDKSRKSRSLMGSFRRSILHRRKKNKKNQQNENTESSTLNTTRESSGIPHSISAEPCLSISSTDTPKSQRHSSIYRSFRNIFRSKSNKKSFDTSSTILEHPESVMTLTPKPKKKSLFRRFKSEKNKQTNVSTNSLTSADCTRSESVRNTPIRANVGHPVTITKPLVQ